LTLLADPEWRQWSDREIARRCAVGHRFVGHLRQSLSGDDPQIERLATRGGKAYEFHRRPSRRGG
jgi:hypothetical protein